MRAAARQGESSRHEHPAIPMTPQDYLVQKTGGRSIIEVLFPMPGDAWKTASLPPTCVLGVVIFQIFGKWPSAN